MIKSMVDFFTGNPVNYVTGDGKLRYCRECVGDIV